MLEEPKVLELVDGLNKLEVPIPELLEDPKFELDDP